MSRFFPASQFAKNTIILMTGTGVAQALTVAVSPILTRIYTPNDFGVYALYLALLSVIGPIASSRLEMAIMLPDKQEEVNSIVSIIFLLTTLVSIITFVIVYFFNSSITYALGNSEISSWLYLLPLSIFINSIYQAYLYLLIREKAFKKLATNKVTFSLTTSITQVGFGYAGFGGFGILLSNLIAYGIVISLLIKTQIISNLHASLKFNNLKSTFVKYGNFAKYDVPSSLVNVGANQLPIVALGKLFSMNIVGYYSFTYRILTLPLNLLSNSVLDVFKQKAAEDYNSYGNCRAIYIKTLKSLALAGIIPFLALLLFAPDVFAFVFGEKWKESGVYAQILAPMFILKFVTNPLSYIFYIVKKQKFDLLGQLLLFVLIVIAVWIGKESGDEKAFLMFFSASYSFIYLVYLFLSYKFSGGNVKHDEKD